MAQPEGQRFTQYPAASTGDYADATTFLIANEDGDIKQASLEGLSSIYGCNIQCTSLPIASADVLQLNSTPLTIVPAQGAGTAIEVISSSYKINYNSTAYATNTGLIITVAGASQWITKATLGLSATLSCQKPMTFQHSGLTTSTQYIENADLQVSVETGDPTTGDSDIEVYVLYRVITL